jgi:glycosyltransferase involved in cell wall biosynthesis
VPSISVIMCVYNEEDCLPESIESVLCQDFTDFELIIVDDNSTDRSVEIIKDYQKRDDRIVVIKNNRNMGPAIARNLGIKRARGDYIAILDSDDIALPGRLKIQYEYLEKNEEIYLVGGNLIVIDGAGEEKDVWKSKCCHSAEVESALPEGNCMAHSTVMFRNTNEFFYRWKFEPSEDYDLYLNMLTAGKRMANISHFLTKYRLRSTSLSFKRYAEMQVYAQQAQQFYQQRIKSGYDEYEKFDPKELLADREHDISVLKTIDLALKMKNWDLARKYLGEYRNTPRKSLKKYLNYAVKIQICRINELRVAIESFLGFKKGSR